jgi:hypothetical protein
MKALLHKPREIINDLIGKVAYKLAIVYIKLVSFGLFFHPFSHTHNIGHVNYYILQQNL